MIEIKIPKEVTKFEPKLIGPFTVRQSIVLVIIVPIISVIYMQLSKQLDSTICAYFCVPIAGIGALFGWVKPYGLPFEKYLSSVFVSSVLAPAVRLYKTENYYDILSKQAMMADKKADKKSDKPKKKKGKGESRNVKKKRYF